MNPWLERIRHTTPAAVLKWASVAFVVCLYVLVVVSIILAIVGVY